MVLYENERSHKTNYIYNQKDKNLNFQKHMHYSFEVIFVHSGELLCEVENTLYHLKAHQALLILPGQIHSYVTAKHSESYLCVFSNDLVDSFYGALKGKKLSNPMFRYEDNFIGCLQNDKSNLFLKKSVFYKICGTVLDQSSVLETEKTDFILTGLLAFYIQNNFTRDISLKKIADEYGYNYTYLSAFFNKNFNKNFSAYVNEFRLKYAAHLLDTTDTDITNIASLSGFSTIRNFNMAFKNMYGESPMNYRKKVKL